MKKRMAIFLACLTAAALFAGCADQKTEQGKGQQTTAVGNPWSDWDSLEEAETAAGFSLDIPEVISDRYTAAVFRTLNNELIEVIYRDGDLDVRVRKQKGEGQDLSGDYNQYDICTEQNLKGAAVVTYRNSGNSAVKQLISYRGYSWSITAPEDVNEDFVNAILEEG